MDKTAGGRVVAGQGLFHVMPVSTRGVFPLRAPGCELVHPGPVCQSISNATKVMFTLYANRARMQPSISVSVLTRESLQAAHNTVSGYGAAYLRLASCMGGVFLTGLFNLDRADNRFELP